MDSRDIVAEFCFQKYMLYFCMCRFWSYQLQWKHLPLVTYMDIVVLYKGIGCIITRYRVLPWPSERHGSMSCPVLLSVLLRQHYHSLSTWYSRPSGQNPALTVTHQPCTETNQMHPHHTRANGTHNKLPLEGSKFNQHAYQPQTPLPCVIRENTQVHRVCWV